MNFVTGYLVYFPAVLAGALLVHQLWHGNQPSRLLFKFGLGAGLGLGLTSLITFLTLSITGRLIGFMAVQITLLFCGLALTWMNRKSAPLLPVKFALTGTQKTLLAVFLGVLVVMLGAYLLYAIMTPTGRFDAWMIYNRAARFIFRDPENWQHALSPQLYWLFHADYPLLVPMNVAGAWSTLGTENMRAAQAQSMYFLIGIFCMLMGALAALRTTGQACLAGITFLGMPILFLTAAREEADVPLAFFMLSTITLLFLYHQERNTTLVTLAGLAAGLAAWTKNEGVLFLITGSAAWLLLLYLQGRTVDLKWYTLGLFLPVAVVVSYKIFLAPPNDLFATRASISLLTRITSPEKVPIIVENFVQKLFTFGNGKLSIFLIGVYGLIVGLEKSKAHRLPALAAVFTVFLQLIGYFMIYVLTPHDINWHLSTSLYRLVLHIFPLALFILFAIITDPETIFRLSRNIHNRHPDFGV